MKKTGLIIVIIVCIVLFFSTLAGGILLTVRTIGWNNLQNEVNLKQRLRTIFDDLHWPPFIAGTKESFTTDETLTADLAGISEIKITAISENVKISIGGSNVAARLYGDYSSWGGQLTWHCDKEGGTLRIYADYPRLGIPWNSLAIDVVIPPEYAAAVKVSCISGSCTFPGDDRCIWSSFQFNGVSGNLNVDCFGMQKIQATTVSGGTHLTRCAGLVDANSVSGKIDVACDYFAGATLKTVSGQVELALPADASANLTFTTVSGGFTNEGLDVNILSQTRRKITGTLGQGSQPLSVNTVSGGLLMKKLGS
jgi:hypothetical protein